MLTRRCAVTSAMAACAIGLAIWWAAMPFELNAPQVDVAPLTTAPPATAAARTLAVLDENAFSATLWAIPPAPPPEVMAEPKVTEPPPQLMLLAITREGERRIAAIYDERANRIVLAEAGTAFSDITITAVTDSGVEFAWGNRQSQLVLRKDES